MVAFSVIGEQSSPLGNTANISAKNKKRAKKYTLLNFAQKLLTEANVVSKRSGNPHRTRLCHAHRTYNADAITIALTSSDIHNSQASFGGLQTCGSIWACPVCAAREAVKKGEEVLKALELAKRENWQPVMVALTARHNVAMRLEGFKNQFKAAWNMFSSHRRWKMFKKIYGVQHEIVNRELTYGDNGWHYHMHLLLFLDFGLMDAAAAANLQEMLEALWMSCLEAKGLDGIPSIAAKVSSHGNVGQNYLTKIGLTISESNGKLEYEMTSSETKSGKSIWDILRHAYYGDEKSAALYIEFVEAMQDTNFLTFSHGLKALIEDIELPVQEAKTNAETKEDWAEISPYWWNIVRRSYAMGKLLELAAETRDIAQCRAYLYSLQEELIDADILPESARQWRFRVLSSEDFPEAIRRIEP